MRNWKEILEGLNSKAASEAELDILKYWEEKGVLEKSIENRPEDNPFTFYDGPITANNKPHYGHALTMVIKDIVPRYRTMKGYRVDRSLGWDCQGIPVEYEVEKKLGFEAKEDIEKYGIAKFNDLCRASVKQYQGEIGDLTTRMGRWVNKKEEYATMDPQYIESLWWSLKELYNKNLLYQGYKVVPYSTRAGTTLSNSEVSLGGYKEIKDTAITIKFKVVNEDKYLLAWTTTPWTMPGNLLVAAMKGADYVEVKFNGENLILAKELASKVLEGEYEVVKEYKGEDLVGMEYEALYPYYEDRRAQGAFKVIVADHVTLEDGTGLVHQAPYGEEDFLLLSEMGIELFDYLDDGGSFTEEVEQFKGMFYKKANKYIVQDLEKRNLMFHHVGYTHRMPMCWRTDTPLIYKPVKSWYVNVKKIKDKMVSENQEVGWTPNHIKDGRFGKWLEGARDWALSRKRYWGTPLPVWICDKCNEVEVLGSFEEIKEKSGVEITDPHKPFIDEVHFSCSKCDGEMNRVEDVIDVWYDSGAMPFARFHYPFENKDLFEKKYPAQFIAEGIDQTRGWFYTLHVLGIALFGSKSFENVIVNGFALSEDGTKMSKRSKNYTSMDVVFEKFGADPLRLYFLSSPIVRAEDVVFDEKFLKDINSSVLFPLWNSLKYFLNYAQIHNWEVQKEVTLPESENLMDQWVLTKLQELTNEMTGYMDKYRLQKTTKVAIKFIDDLSRWYIRGSRNRFVEGDKDALETLYFVLHNLSRLLAPVIPFITERMYIALTGEESVHLTDYPEINELTEDQDNMLVKMKTLRDVISIGQSVRVNNSLKVRQPLAIVQVAGAKFKQNYSDILIGELNVKKAEFVEEVNSDKGYVSATEGSVSVSLDTNLTEELKTEGLYRELSRTIQSGRKKAGLNAGESVEIVVGCNDNDLNKLIESSMTELLEDVSASKITVVEKISEEIFKVNKVELSLEFKK